MKASATTTNINERQKKFADEYCKHFNATAAAISAGYSENTACVIGSENLRKPNIKVYINKRLTELAVGAEEATKLIGDIARSNLNEFFTTEQIEYTPRIKKSLKIIIQECQVEIDFEEEFAKMAKLKGDALREHNDLQKERKLRKMRYEFEFKKNKNAFRIVDGQTEFREQIKLDIKKLVSDKEKGRIKSFKIGKYGPEVELYGADGALRDIGKMHGLFEKDNKQKTLNISINGKKVNVGG